MSRVIQVCEVAAHFLLDNVHVPVVDPDAMHGVARRARPDILLAQRMGLFLRKLKKHFESAVERHVDSEVPLPPCAGVFSESYQAFLQPYYHRLPYDWPQTLLSVQEIDLLDASLGKTHGFLKTLESFVMQWFDHCYKVGPEYQFNQQCRACRSRLGC